MATEKRHILVKFTKEPDEDSNVTLTIKEAFRPWKDEGWISFNKRGTGDNSLGTFQFDHQKWYKQWGHLDLDRIHIASCGDKRKKQPEQTLWITYDEIRSSQAPGWYGCIFKVSKKEVSDQGDDPEKILAAHSSAHATAAIAASGSPRRTEGRPPTPTGRTRGASTERVGRPITRAPRPARGLSGDTLVQGRGDRSLSLGAHQERRVSTTRTLNADRSPGPQQGVLPRSGSSSGRTGLNPSRSTSLETRDRPPSVSNRQSARPSASPGPSGARRSYSF